MGLKNCLDEPFDQRSVERANQFLDLPPRRFLNRRVWWWQRRGALGIAGVKRLAFWIVIARHPSAVGVAQLRAIRRSIAVGIQRRQLWSPNHVTTWRRLR